VTDFDVRGELCVRGPTVIRGYFNNEKANRESWDEDGYFHTGDIMYRDRKNKLWYIVDRKKVRKSSHRTQPNELLSLPIRSSAVMQTKGPTSSLREKFV
jgi:4-coumarate--CoA ligase